MSKVGNRQYEKVLTVLLAAKGNVVTKDELETTLKDQIETYRLSTYVWNIRKKLGGHIEVLKIGKKVTGYKLVNVDKFKNFGTAVVAAATVQMPKAPKKPKMPKLPSNKKVAAAVKVEPVATAAPAAAEPSVKVGEVPSYSIDQDFDSFQIDDVMKGM
jgi:hypothetical protein